MHRIVHLDLKGAPLKVPFLEKVLLCAKKWGATGILLEWEDTFPYTGGLMEIGSGGGCGGDGLYSMEEVQRILGFAKEIGLEAIQLIQTIGHLEFVLKHPAFRSMREVDRSCSVLCPSHENARSVISAMLKQALDAQPDAKFLHIGADEVWHTAVCPKCQTQAATHKYKAHSLYLDHIRDIVLNLKRERPDLTVLMWDDMLRPISLECLKDYQMGELVQPVVWDYNIEQHFHISHIWYKYQGVFRGVWAASAFKGANGSCQIKSPVARYVSNHVAWANEMKNYSGTVNFSGVILTGWSRYDHYATLCELLPVSLPSLASCLRVITGVEDMDPVMSEELNSSEWPGEALAWKIGEFAERREQARAFLHGDQIATWLNPWQVQKRYTNPTQIEGISATAQNYLTNILRLKNDIHTELLTITGPRSAKEWVETFVVPLERQLSDIKRDVDERCRFDASVRPED